MLRSSRWAYAVACLLVFTTSAGADDSTQALNHAVVLYHGQQDAAAMSALDRLISAGARDPKAYYFRGLARWRSGKEEQAREDFRAGAQLESANPDPNGMTSIRIYRAQGPARLALEQYRTDARLAAYRIREQQRWERFQSLEGDPAASSNPAAATTPAASPSQPSAAPAGNPFTPKAPAAPLPTNPFGTPPAASPPATPAPPPAAPPADPFKK